MLANLFVLTLIVAHLARLRAMPVRALSFLVGARPLLEYCRSAAPLWNLHAIPQAVAVLSMALAIGMFWARPEARAQILRNVSRCAPVAAFLAYSLVSAAWSQHPRASVLSWARNSEVTLLTLTGIVTLVLDREHLEELLKETVRLWAPFLVFVLFTGDWGARGLISSVPSDFKWEGLGAGEVGHFSLPLLAGTCSIAIECNRSLHRSIRIPLVAGLLTLMVRSGARGQLVAWFVATAVILLATSSIVRTVRKAVWPLIALAGGVAGALLLAPSVHSQILYRWSSFKIMQSLAARLEVVSDLYVAWISGGLGSWIFGLGTQSHRALELGAHPHCVPAEILFEYGLAGVALAAWCVSRALPGFRASLRNSPSFSVELCSCALLVYFVLTALKSGSFLGSSWLWAFFLLFMIHRRFEGGDEVARDETGPYEWGADGVTPSYSRVEG